MASKAAFVSAGGLIIGIVAGLAAGAMAKPVIGKSAAKLNYRDKVACMTGTSSATESAATEAQARAAVVVKWDATVYGSWQAAQNKTITCTPTPGGYKCTAVAIPCTPIRQ
jgi:hypothetical protein